MTDHDQLFKHLFQEFLGDLLRIVHPELAAKLRVEDPTFLESELFTRFPAGERRYLDLVARVESVGGEPEVVLVHVEGSGRPGGAWAPGSSTTPCSSGWSTTTRWCPSSSTCAAANRT